MVQCLHKTKDYIKSKLELWRAQKRIPLVGVISGLTCAGPQTTPTHVRQYMAKKVIFRKSGATFRHGAVFQQKQGLYQKTAKAMESPKMHSSRRAISGLTCAGPQTTLSHVRQYKAENGILGNSGATFHHGAVFAPKQGSSQKESRAMESPKMYPSRR